MKTLLIIISIMAFRTEGGNIRLSLWDGTGQRSALIVSGSPSYEWFRAHVSRDSVGSWGATDAETVRVTFSGDTILSIR